MGYTSKNIFKKCAFNQDVKPKTEKKEEKWVKKKFVWLKNEKFFLLEDESPTFQQQIQGNVRPLTLYFHVLPYFYHAMWQCRIGKSDSLAQENNMGKITLKTRVRKEKIR